MTLGHRLSVTPSLFRGAFDPGTFTIFAVITEVGDLIAEVLENENPLMRSGNLLQHTKSRLDMLDDRIKNIQSIFPPRMAFSLIPKALCPSALPLAEELWREEDAPEYAHTYFNIFTALIWNMLRYAQIRINQIQLKISAVLGTPPLIRQKYLMAVNSLCTEICSTTAFFISGADNNLFGPVEGRKIRGVRIYVLLRYLAAARMGFDTVSRYESQKIGLSSWLHRVLECIRQEFGMTVPYVSDPLG